MCTFDDPKYLKSIIGKHASVTTINNEVHSGVLYVIDPISKTVVMVNQISSEHLLKIIPYTSVKSFEIDPSLIVNPQFSFESDLKTDTSNQFEDIKLKLKDWFNKNEIKVEEESGNLKLSDYRLTIEPPYGPEQCFCDNTIVLERIRGLIVQMPL